MKHTSIRELHIRTSELVREAAEGNIIVIERRGEPVAELRPITPRSRLTTAQKAQIFASMKKLWARMPPAADSTAILEDDRNR
ncbi:MAG: type II toxin-antitoxin system prevent-host-death family antitoxin [Acidobacteria bacterium]|nr:type II toxin-antitoxin system prevent-host-death family antitoxin [Acidobacteriota bacterium]